MSLRTRIGLWAPVVGFMMLLYAASAQPHVRGPEWVWDKAAHTAAYAILGFLALRALHHGLAPLRVSSTLSAMLISVGYGALDELHQAFVPGRHSSVLDLVADAIGAALSIVLFVLAAREAAPGLGIRPRKEET